jgi:hypothetical protein
VQARRAFGVLDAAPSLILIGVREHELCKRVKRTFAVALYDWALALTWGILGIYWVTSGNPIGPSAEVASHVHLPLWVAGVLTSVASVGIIYGLLRPSPSVHVFGMVTMGTVLGTVALVSLSLSPNLRSLAYLTNSLLCGYRVWSMKQAIISRMVSRHD